jgi:ferredoxin
MPKIKFLSQQIEVQVASGSDLLKVHNQFPDLPLKFGCRRGVCGTCVMRVVEGGENLTKRCLQEQQTLKEKKRLSAEEPDDEYRLACQCALNGDITVL